MAQFPIDIKIDTSDASKLGPLNRQLNETDRAATGASKAAGSLAAAVGAIATTATLGQIVKLTDSYTKIQNSIVNVVSGTAELTARTGELLRVANQSRSSFEATAALYGKLKRSTDELGISQDRVLRITDLINKGFIASGATSTEATNAITQLTQGLSAGALRGDEFNSVAEQAPVILRAVAQETGKTTGELRAFAAEGKITSELLIRSIENYGDTIDREFARTAVTFDQQRQVAANLATEWVGSSDGIRAASQAAGAVLVTLAENLDTVAAVAGVVASVVGVRMVQSLVASTAALIAQTTAARAAAGVLALLGGPAGVAILAGSALLYYADSVETAGKASRDSKLAAELDKLTSSFKEMTREGQRKTLDDLTQQQIDLNAQLADANRLLDESKRKAEYANKARGQSFVGGDVGASAQLATAQARVAELQTQLDATTKKLETLFNTRAPDADKWLQPAKPAAVIQFYDDLTAKMQQQIALIGLTEVEQARLQARQELMNKAAKEGVTLTEAQIAAYANLAAQGVVKQQQVEADQYILTLAKQVAAERDVGVQAEINANLARLGAGATAEQRMQVEALTQSLYAQQLAQQAISETNAVRQYGIEQETPNQKLEREIQERKDLLFNAYYEELIGQEEYNQRVANLDKELATKRAAAQAASNSAMRQAAAQGLDALAGIIEAGGGKSSKAYRAVFAASRAFALADSIAKLAQAQAQALADPTAVTLPQKIANYAAVATAGAGLLASLRSPANFADGGYVSGAGTGRSDSIPAWLSNGEFVMPANRTEQYRTELDAMRRGVYGSAAPSAGARVTINNYASDVATVSVAEGPDGELIATIDRRIAEQTPGIMAEQAADPYSRFNKSITGQYYMERR